MKYIYLILIPILLFVALDNAQACSCQRLNKIDFNDFNTIFIGTANSRFESLKSFFYNELETEFLVTKTYVGDPAKKSFLILHDTNTTSCRVIFHYGNEYIILAIKHDGQLRSNYCGSVPLDSDAGKALKMRLENELMQWPLLAESGH